MEKKGYNDTKPRSAKAGKYINPFFDWSFKRIFGNDSVKDILIGFLNALFAGKHVIVDVKYENVERQYDDQDTRAIIYDVFCTTDKGERLIVEMQNRSQKFFKDHALYTTNGYTS